MNQTASSTPPPIGDFQPAKTSGLAISSLVLGILSLLCFTIITAIPGVICGHKALSKIKKSNGTLSGRGLAIAGLITGYIGIAWAVIFIPMLLAIAIPNFVKARDTAQMNACINNLRQIDAAKNLWALEHTKAAGAIPTAADLSPYIKDGFQSLHCPADGIYIIGPVGTPPTCSIPHHVLPE